MHKFMKHSTKLIFALMLACFSLSCDDKDGDVNEAKLTVTPEAIECSPAAETKTITIQTDEAWIVSTQYDWIELSSPIGAGNGTSTVKIQANNSMSAREGSVVVAVKNKQVSIPVSQQGLDISVTPSSIKVSEKATKRTLTIDCKGSWTAESDAEWCTVEKDGNQLNVSILYNQATEERKANIEVKSESGNTVIVTVTQSKGDGKPEPVFSVSSPDFEIPAGEEGDIEAELFEQTYTFNVTTPSKSSVWDVNVSYPTGGEQFLTCKNIYSRVGDGQFTVTSSKNLTRQAREALLEIVCNTNGETQTYKLSLKQPSYALTIASVPVLDKEYGTEQSFGISITPELELAYQSDVDWIENVEKDVFKIGDNITDTPRSGKVYIKLAKDGSVIDSVEISQRDGLQHQIPFACNSYVTPLDPTVVAAPACASAIFGGGSVNDGTYGAMKSATSWRKTYDSQNIQISFYFRTEITGDLNLGLVARMNRDTDTARVAVSIGDVSYDVQVTGRTLTSWPVGKFKVDKPGYVRVNIRGIYTNTTYYPFLSDMYLGGAAIKYSPDKTADLTYVTTKQIQASDAHWIRRGPSCHLGWIQPSGNTEYFYNEINVPVGQDVPAAYFMTTGGSGFYMGIQPNEKGKNRNVLFSVWNNENDPKNIKYSEVVRHGENSKPNSFGHEGSGIQTWRYYDWDAGKTYATLVHVRPEVKDGQRTGNTLYTGYFWSEELGWELIAEIRRPGIVSYYTGSYSFSENFGPHNGFVTRSVDFPNQWMRTTDGVWHEVLSARVTADGCGSQGLRTDFYGGVRDGHFYLQNIGYFDQKITSGTRFSRPASGKSAPDIDFDALSKLGIWVNP